MTAAYSLAKQGVSCYYCTLTHCTRSERRLRLITLKRVNERGCAGIRYLLSRQQIHSADGDEGDVCTATIFPGRVTVNAAMLPEEASRLSVVVNECELRLRPLPAPLLRAASHNYRLLLLLPSSWHADDLCQASLMGNRRARKRQRGIHCSALLGDIIKQSERKYEHVSCLPTTAQICWYNSDPFVFSQWAHFS